jgi:hypothetical protein
LCQAVISIIDELWGDNDNVLHPSSLQLPAFISFSHSTYLVKTRLICLHTLYLLTNKERRKKKRKEWAAMPPDIFIDSWSIRSFFFFKYFRYWKMFSDLMDDDILSESLGLLPPTLTKSMHGKYTVDRWQF